MNPPLSRSLSLPPLSLPLYLLCHPPLPLPLPAGEVVPRAPAALQPRAFELLPLGAVVPDGWLLNQLVLQANSLSGYLSVSTFPGASTVNQSASGEERRKKALPWQLVKRARGCCWWYCTTKPPSNVPARDVAAHRAGPG